MIPLLIALAVAIAAFLLMARLLPKAPREPRPRDADLLEQHRCRPPDSHEHTPGQWVTHREVGDEWRCRCGRGWSVQLSARGLWRAWFREPALDQEPTP